MMAVLTFMRSVIGFPFLKFFLFIGGGGRQASLGAGAVPAENEASPCSKGIGAVFATFSPNIPMGSG